MTTLRSRPLLRLAAGSLIVAFGLTVPSTGASAHVTVQAPGAEQGGFTKLVFRAPTEKPVATTKLEIAFPRESPIASVRVKPQPGWSYEMTKVAPATPLSAHGTPVTEVVERIVWTATGAGIGATEFGEFEVSAGPLPTVERLTFRALQTYADGEVVRWIEDQAPGAAEPERPAPVLELAAPTAEDTEAAAAEKTDNGNGLAIAGLVTAVVALLTAIAALARALRKRQNT